MKAQVSIIIPLKNRYEFIGETLDAVIAQSHENWECIVVDDNSTDYIPELMEFYTTSDRRLIFYKNQKKGAAAARNLGMERANGNYILFLDSDDLISSNKIESQLNILEQFKNTNTIVVCKWAFFEAKDKILNFEWSNFISQSFKIEDYFDLISKRGGFFPLHSFLFPVHLIEESAKWDETLNVNDDGEFIFRVLLNSERIVFDENTFVLYRKVENHRSLSTINERRKVKSLILSWKKIEAYAKNCDAHFSYTFIESKKKKIYDQIKWSYPLAVIGNSSFFANQIKGEAFLELKNAFFKRLKARIKKHRNANRV